MLRISNKNKINKNFKNHHTKYGGYYEKQNKKGIRKRIQSR